jgi:hypothetical protein
MKNSYEKLGVENYLNDGVTYGKISFGFCE